MAVNKVIYGTTVIIDITDSTVTADTLAEGVVAYNAKGERIVGNAKVVSKTAALGTASLGTMILGKE